MKYKQLKSYNYFCKLCSVIEKNKTVKKTVFAKHCTKFQTLVLRFEFKELFYYCRFCRCLQQIFEVSQ